MKRSEQGLTLVEVLAVLTILSIAGIVIWQVFLQGYKYSNQAVSKNQLAQEANIVITQLTRIHQTYGEYKIISSDGVIEVLDSKDQSIALFDHSQFDYKASSNEFDINNQSIYPSKTGNDLLIKLEISDKHGSNSITIETYLYRLKDDESIE